MRRIANLFISAGWLWVFHSLGWITFVTELPLWQAIAIIAFVSWLIETLVGIALLAFIVVTAGLGCLIA